MRKKRTPTGPDRSLAGQLRDAIRIDGRTPYAIGKAADLAPDLVARFLGGERDILLGSAGRIAAALGCRLAPARSKGRPPARGEDPGRVVETPGPIDVDPSDRAGGPDA